MELNCKHNNSLEFTYSYGGHLNKMRGRSFFENVIQISRCCLLKPNWYIDSYDFIQLFDIMDYIKRLETPDSPSEKLDHPMCEGHYCNLASNSEIKEIIVGLSFACNLNCYNCWYKGHHFDSEFQKQLYFHTLNNLRGHNLSTIVLTNKGEPFYYIDETMAYLKSLSIKDTKRVFAVTNGNTLNSYLIKEMSIIRQEKDIAFSFMFSIDAISENVYRKVRYGGDFSKVLNNIENCINCFGSNNVIASFTCKDLNIQELSNAAEYFKSRFGIKTQITFDYFNPKLTEIAEKTYGFRLEKGKI